MNKFQRKVLSALSMFIFLFILSCDEENSTQIENPSTKYMPLQIGNYWIYETEVYDKYYTIIENYTDSATVVSKEKIFGYDAYLLVCFRNGKLLDTTYYYTTENKVHRIYDENDTIIPNIEKGWRLFADFETDDSWNLMNSDDFEYEFVYFDSLYVGKLMSTINVKMNPWLKFELDSVEYDAVGARHLNDSKGTFIYEVDRSGPFPDTTIIERYKSIETTYRYVENIGLVSIVTSPYHATFKNLATNENATRDYYGERRVLTRYFVQ